ncbi:kunitz/BPTI-like toxin [Varanus komodoensis]|uniref:kunitz/BPTI-like toxin n=1 Tax=Varanus komodoensis TaxID=61221 RepID=UPI001CF7E814|nr:kunitz/BPTI-like toxin [Varanus komodoensis]
MQPGARLLPVGLLALWAQRTPLSAQDHPDVCRLPRDPGPCKAFRTRTFYNVTSKACERFQYGGCGGNKNNFVNPELCLRTCQRPGGEKPGSCPVFPAYVREPCEKLCKHDQDCLGALKCCSMMCSMVCLRPFPDEPQP